MTASLRSRLIRLAHTNSDIRPHILPLLEKTAMAAPFNTTMKNILELVGDTQMESELTAKAQDAINDILWANPGLSVDDVLDELRGKDLPLNPKACANVIKVAVGEYLARFQAKVKSISVDSNGKVGLNVEFGSNEISDKDIERTLTTRGIRDLDVYTRGTDGHVEFTYDPNKSPFHWFTRGALTKLVAGALS